MTTDDLHITGAELTGDVPTAVADPTRLAPFVALTPAAAAAGAEAAPEPNQNPRLFTKEVAGGIAVPAAAPSGPGAAGARVAPPKAVAPVGADADAGKVAAAPAPEARAFPGPKANSDGRKSVAVAPLNTPGMVKLGWTRKQPRVEEQTNALRKCNR